MHATPSHTPCPPPKHTQEAAEPSGTLKLTAFIRYAGLSANQLVTLPGAGDFQVDLVEGLPDVLGTGGGSNMDMAGSAPVLLAKVRTPAYSSSPTYCNVHHNLFTVLYVNLYITQHCDLWAPPRHCNLVWRALQC